VGPRRIGRGPVSCSSLGLRGPSVGRGQVSVPSFWHANDRDLRMGHKMNKRLTRFNGIAMLWFMRFMPPKAVTGLIILLVAGISPLLVGQLIEDSETAEYSDHICIRDISDFEAVFLEHQFDFLRIVPPSVDFILVQPYHAPLFFDSDGFSKTFSDNLIGEYTKEGIPEYEVRVYEDPTTREIKFLNDSNQLLEALR